MKMPKRQKVALRFGVGNGRVRASTWTLWTEVGRGESDVYLANRRLGHALKASMHQSGEWHIAFDRKYLDAHAVAEEWPSRYQDQWRKPDGEQPGVPLAFRIVTPSVSVNIDVTSDIPPNIRWVLPPPDDKTVEIAIIITKQAVHTSTWPGHRAMNTALIGKIVLENGDTVWAVSHVIDLPGSHPAAVETLGEPGRRPARAQKLDREA